MSRIFVVFVSIFILSSCQKESGQRSLASDIALSTTLGLKESWNTMAVALDYVRKQTSAEKYNIIPSSAGIVILDSTYTDGDGIEVSIHFLDTFLAVQKGIRCLDGNYRAGTLTLKLTKPWNEVGSVLTVIANDDYKSGNISSLRSLVGVCQFTRVTSQMRKWEVTSFFEREFFELEMNVNYFEDSKKYSCSGSLRGNSKETKTNYTANTSKDIIFSWQENCNNKMIDGSFSINNNDLSDDLTIDYNPYNDMSCDEQARWSLGRTEDLFYFY